MKSFNSFSKHALSTLFLFFAFLMIAEAQIIADFSQLRRTDGLIMQRIVDNDDTQVRAGVMNFHADTINNSEDFDYIYFRAAAQSTDNGSNNMVLTNSGLLMVGQDTDICARLANTKFRIDTTDSNVKLYVNGSIAVSDGNATNLIVSDERFKKNIKPLKNSLEVIRNSNFVEYQYNSLSGVSSNKKYYGILAQEMKEVLPSTVTKARKKLTLKDSRDTEFYMFNPNDLIYSGLNAIKELDEENQALETKLEEESVKNEALEQRVVELERMVHILINGNNTSREVPFQKRTNTTSAKLFPNTPNPLNRLTTIEYFLPDDISTAYIFIRDLNGRTIDRFELNGTGYGKVEFNIKKYSMKSGTYVYSLVVNDILIETRTMMLIK